MISSVVRIAKLLAGLCTALFLFYAVEDFRGARAWQAERSRLEKNGEELNWAKLVPEARQIALPGPMPPPAGLIDWRSPGFLQVPGFGREFAGPGIAADGLVKLNQWRRLLSPPEDAATGETACESGKAFLKATETLDAPIGRLVEASRRGPVARWSVGLNSSPAATELPPLLAIRRLVNIMRLRAAANCACGNAGQAIGEMRVIARVEESLRGLPFSITYLIRIAVEDVLLDSIQDALARGALNGRERGEVESLMADDWLAGARDALRGERNWLVFYAESDLVGSEGWGGEAMGLMLIPRGWLLRQAIYSARFTQEGVRLLSDPARVDPRAIDALAQGRSQERSTPYNFIARIATTSLGRLARSAVGIQTRIELVRTALALAGYRDSAGSFPEDLAQLTPRYLTALPRDMVSGDILRYRKTRGGFVLYSVGWDLNDEGGRQDSHQFFSQRPDWVLALGEP